VIYKLKQYFSLLMLILLSVFFSKPVFPAEDVSLMKVTPNVKEYAINTVKPVLDSYTKRDTLSLLTKISDILIDSERGIHTNKIEPSTYIIYDKLDKIKLGFLITFKLSSEQKKT